jgi:hypothetical protein
MRGGSTYSHDREEVQPTLMTSIPTVPNALVVFTCVCIFVCSYMHSPRVQMTARRKVATTVAIYCIYMLTVTIYML